jgi:hypothetical protein
MEARMSTQPILDRRDPGATIPSWVCEEKAIGRASVVYPSEVLERLVDGLRSWDPGGWKAATPADYKAVEELHKAFSCGTGTDLSERANEAIPDALFMAGHS